MLPLPDFTSPGPRRITVEGVSNPVVSVLISTAAPQLSQPLDYLVPRTFDAAAQIGCLVKVKINGRVHVGVITARGDTTDWQKPLREIERVLGKLQILDSETLKLLETVSLHYGTTASQLLRYALPVRRAKVEKLDFSPVDLTASAPSDVDFEHSTWAAYTGGTEMLTEIAKGGNPRAVVSALPQANRDDTEAEQRFRPLWELAAATWTAGKQSLFILPTNEEAADAYLYLKKQFSQESSDAVVLYTSQMPLTEAYQAFMQARFGRAAVIVGTRGAVFVPLAKPGLFYCWDNMALSLSSDMHPNFSARMVLLMRCVASEAALVFSHYSVNAADMQLVQRHFADQLKPTRDMLRACTPRFSFLEIERQPHIDPTFTTPVPTPAMRLVRKALQTGPVLIQIPRDASFSVVSCVSCGQAARCPVCQTALDYRGSQLQCSRCGYQAADYACPRCGERKTRGRFLQSRTVIDDIGRLFPSVPVLVSRLGEGRLTRVDNQKRLVVAYPGTEPLVDGGYRAGLILRPNMLAARTALWTGQEVMRRFLAMASLVKPGGTVFVTESINPDWQQALIRWDPWGWAANDLRERQDGHFAPAWRTALLSGENLQAPLDYLRELFKDATILGPVPTAKMPGLYTAFVSVSLALSADFGRALRALQLRYGGFRKDSPKLHVEVDPSDPAGQIV